MANPKPAPPSPSPASKDRRWLSRSTMPYLVAAMLASAAMAWYFFIFVPTKLEYFVGLRFRTLAVAGGQVKSKTESLSKSFGGAVGGVGSTEKDLRRYLEILVPEIRLGLGTSDALNLVAKDAWGKDVNATVTWEDVVRPAAAVSARDFDDLILANADGDVVWQRERTTPRVGNLKELLNAASEPGGWLPSWQVHTTTPAAPSSQALPSTAVLKPVNLGGTSSILLVQAVNLLPAGIANAPPTGARLYVAGLVSHNGLQRQAMRVPVAWVVLFALPVVLLFLALPYVKLATLTPKERYSFANIVLLAIATVCAAGIGATLPFVSGATGPAADDKLDAFATGTETHLADETGKILDLAGEILRLEPLVTNAGTLKDCLVPFLDTKKLPTQRCGLWEALAAAGLTGIKPGSLELDVAVWLDQAGDQAQKWTTKTQITGRTSHRTFDHFRDVKAGHTWRFTESNPKLVTVGPRSLRFTIEPLRTPTTSELGVVFALPIPNKDQYLALNVRPQSLVDPVVPPGLGFAVVAPDGRVLFHSEEALSLEENFFEEVGGAQEARAKARSRHSVTWSGDYHGRPHRLHMQAVSRFVDCPWLIVTFQEMEPILAAQVEQQSAIARLGAINLIVLALAAFAYWSYSRLVRKREIRDMLLSSPQVSPREIGVLAGLAVAACVAWLATYRTANQWILDWLYLGFLLLPVAAVFVFKLARRRAASAATESRAGLRAAELGLLVFLIGAAPAAGFARLVFRVQDVKMTERWMEISEREWSARRARVMDRVGGPGYSADTRKLLTDPDGFAADWTANPSAPYSYLDLDLDPGKHRTLSRVRTVAGETKPPDAVSLSTGQELLRWVLAWTPVESKDEPGRPKAGAVTGTKSLRLTSVHTRQPNFVAPAMAEVGENLSWFNVCFGVVILVGTFSAVYWARRQLVVPTMPPSPNLRAVISTVAQDDVEAVLLIGPPRTKKDRRVIATVKRVTTRKPAKRIRLLDAQITDEFIEKKLLEVKTLVAENEPFVVGSDRRLWIHLSNLEEQLVTAESRAKVLHLLEKLLDRGDGEPARVLVVTTSVDPIASFEEIFQDESKSVDADVVPEVELCRSSLLLSRFRRCHLPIRSGRSQAPGEKDAWGRWLRYKPAEWEKALESEVAGYAPLAAISRDLTAAWKSDAPVPLKDLARAVTARAQACYELLWTSCTRSEKLVLIQLAQEGLVNPGSRDVVTGLIAKGLIIERPAPAIFNYTFRAFLRRIERRHMITEWEQMEGAGLWVVAGRLIGSSLVAGGVFYLMTQDFSVQSLLPLLSGTGVFGVPLVRDLLARVTGGKSGSGTTA